ncbi:MAG: DUF5656 family protein [Anaerolineae bacterium]
MHNKVGPVVILIAIGLICSFTLAWPTREFSWHGLVFTVSGRMLLGLVLFGLACAGTNSIVYKHPRVITQQQALASCSREVQHPVLHWILPALLTTAVWALLMPPGTQAKVIGVAIASVALALFMYAEYYAVNATARWRAVVQFALQFATYALAALAYFAIRERISLARLVADTMAVVSVLLSLRLLGEESVPFSRVLLCTLGIGSLLGLISWWLLPCLASPLLYSLSLVVFLYALIGMARQFLLGQFRREVSLEYLLVSVLALLVLFLYSR